MSRVLGEKLHLYITPGIERVIDGRSFCDFVMLQKQSSPPVHYSIFRIRADLSCERTIT